MLVGCAAATSAQDTMQTSFPVPKIDGGKPASACRDAHCEYLDELARLFR